MSIENSCRFCDKCFSSFSSKKRHELGYHREECDHNKYKGNVKRIPTGFKICLYCSVVIKDIPDAQSNHERSHIHRIRFQSSKKEIRNTTHAFINENEEFGSKNNSHELANDEDKDLCLNHSTGNLLIYFYIYKISIKAARLILISL